MVPVTENRFHINFQKCKVEKTFSGSFLGLVGGWPVAATVRRFRPGPIQFFLSLDPLTNDGVPGAIGQTPSFANYGANRPKKALMGAIRLH